MGQASHPRREHAIRPYAPTPPRPTRCCARSPTPPQKGYAQAMPVVSCRSCCNNAEGRLNLSKTRHDRARCIASNRGNYPKQNIHIRSPKLGQQFRTTTKRSWSLFKIVGQDAAATSMGMRACAMSLLRFPTPSRSGIADQCAVCLMSPAGKAAGGRRGRHAEATPAKTKLMR